MDHFCYDQRGNIASVTPPGYAVMATSQWNHPIDFSSSMTVIKTGLRTQGNLEFRVLIGLTEHENTFGQDTYYPNKIIVKSIDHNNGVRLIMEAEHAPMGLVPTSYESRRTWAPLVAARRHGDEAAAKQLSGMLETLGAVYNHMRDEGFECGGVLGLNTWYGMFNLEHRVIERVVQDVHRSNSDERTGPGWFPRQPDLTDSGLKEFTDVTRDGIKDGVIKLPRIAPSLFVLPQPAGGGDGSPADRIKRQAIQDFVLIMCKPENRLRFSLDSLQIHERVMPLDDSPETYHEFVIRCNLTQCDRSPESPQLLRAVEMCISKLHDTRLSYKKKTKDGPVTEAEYAIAVRHCDLSDIALGVILWKKQRLEVT